MACASHSHAQRVWGVNGQPNTGDYQAWIPSAVSQQLDYLNELGTQYYRVSFSESRNDPTVLDALVPASQNRANKVQIVPIVFVQPVPSAGYQSNYDAGYAQGKKWADYALSKGYVITHWELGNETSNAKTEVGEVNFFTRANSGMEASDWSDDRFPGAFDAMAGVLRGLYWGIKDSYRANGQSTNILFGDMWLHFGYVKKIMAVRGDNFFPGDMLAWHWYTPNFGGFTTPLVAGDDRTKPSAYAASFGKDIWMTEVGREGSVQGHAAGGSAEGEQAQSSELEREVADLLTVPQVKGIFVYELYDEADKFKNADPNEKMSQAYYGLVTSEKKRKLAFYTYKNIISAHR